MKGAVGQGTPPALRAGVPTRSDDRLNPKASHDHDRGGRHWESWGLRGLLAAIVGFHLLGGNPNGALVVLAITALVAAGWLVDRAPTPPPSSGSGQARRWQFGPGAGPDDFYLLKASALHDSFALERYLHGRRRDLREERLRLHGDDWHELRPELRGGRLTASVDGRETFEEGGLSETVGGLGLWARVTGPGCSAEAQVTAAVTGGRHKRGYRAALYARAPSGS